MLGILVMGVANDMYRTGRSPDGGYINSMEDALKKTQSQMKTKMKYLNPNRYSITKKSDEGRRKALKYENWLGKEKAGDLVKLESQYWHKINWWKSKGFMESIKENNLDDMYKEFNWSPK